MRILTAALLCLALAGCVTSGEKRAFDAATTDWENLVRWNQYHALVDHMHPDYLEANPVRRLDLERLKQFRTTQYRVREVQSQPEGGRVQRVVEIRFYHIHTARERTIVHREDWRWDEERERWLLHSGLPDVTQDY